METGSRVDLHLHSRASGAATSWCVKGLGADVEVQESYQMAKKAGMDFVTLMDHETIEGALTLLHHPDFLSGRRSPPSFRRTVIRWICSSMSSTLGYIVRPRPGGRTSTISLITSERPGWYMS